MTVLESRDRDSVTQLQRDRSSIPKAQLSGPWQALRVPFVCCSHERMPYQRRCRRDSDAYRFEERSPSFGEEYYPARPRTWRRSRGREQHRPRRYQQHCRRRRSRSCSSASSVSSIHSELRL